MLLFTAGCRLPVQVHKAEGKVSRDLVQPRESISSARYDTEFRSVIYLEEFHASLIPTLAHASLIPTPAHASLVPTPAFCCILYTKAGEEPGN